MLATICSALLTVAATLRRHGTESSTFTLASTADFSM